MNKRLMRTDDETMNITQISVGRLLDFINWKFQNEVVICVYDEDMNYRGDISIYPTSNELMWASYEIFFEDWTFDDIYNLKAFEIGHDENCIFIKAEEDYNYTPIQ